MTRVFDLLIATLALILSAPLLALITIVNLRGTLEAGLIFSVPTYLFIASFGGLLLFGVAKALIAAPYHYQQILRYQLGMPVWRALGNTVQTDLQGFAYIFNRDETAVFVDARSPQDSRSETVACAVNIQPGEADVANTDGRLPLLDKGARIVVFADDPNVANQVASEIAKKAYWSSSYFGGTFSDLLDASQVHIHSQRRCRDGLK